MNSGLQEYQSHFRNDSGFNFYFEEARRTPLQACVYCLSFFNKHLILNLMTKVLPVNRFIFTFYTQMWAIYSGIGNTIES